MITLSSNSTIFAVAISNKYAFEWKWATKLSIQVIFKRDWIEHQYPRIAIALSGNNYYDSEAINSWYTFLIPIKAYEVDIELLFSYNYSCYNCSPNDCYPNNQYCMAGSMNPPNGAAIIDRTLFEIALLKYIVTKDKYLSSFALFLKYVWEYCQLDYSSICRRNVLHWLGIDSKKIESIINSNWISNKTSKHSDNYLLQNQRKLWQTRNIAHVPSISIGNVTLGQGQYYAVGTYLCNYFLFSHSYLCNNNCSEYCTLDSLTNGICDEKCKVETCSYDIKDCNDTNTFCHNIHSKDCKDNNTDTNDNDKSSNKTSIIYIIVFSLLGGFILW